MPGLRSKPLKSGKYQAWFINFKGTQQWFTGTKNKKQTERIAASKEEEHREIRLGYRPAPKSTEQHRLRGYADVCADYLAWGGQQGGRGGRPWSEKHAHNRRVQLTWWGEHLAFGILADLADDLLGRVEHQLRDLAAKRTNKTVSNYAEALAAFCDWCVQRGYLDDDPLKNLVGFDTTPITLRRSMALEEIAQVLATCAPERRLLYETALLTGLRKNELQHLAVDHLDLERSGVHLDASWTKNRKPGFQPLPHALALRLAEFARSGEPHRLYELHFTRNVQADVNRIPNSPLLYVPSHPARALDQDLQRCGIPKVTPKGKLDFHAARVAYINLLLEDDQISIKDAQDLARHSATKLTLDVYGRSHDKRMAGAIERMAEKVTPTAVLAKKYVHTMYVEANGAERRIATPYITGGCDSFYLAPEVGLEPTTK